MSEQYEIKTVFSADTSGFDSGTQKAINGMKNFSSSTSNVASSVQNKIQSIGTGMQIAEAAVSVLGVSALKSYGSFSSTMNQAAVVAGGTAKDIKGLTKVAEEMGNELPVSSKEAADAMLSMARDGASLDQIKAEFPAVARAATAAGADLQTTANVVQQAMNIWGKSIGTPAQAAADLTQTANLSNASIEDMQQALATIGGTASNAGISMQDTSTAIGLLTNKGFSAAQASQDLNHAIIQMQAPSKIASKEMQALGLSFNDAQGNMKPFPQILQEISDKTKDMSSSERAAALKNMFGTSGMGAMLPLLESIQDKTGSTTTSWDAFSKELQKTTSSGSQATAFLESQAAEMQQNIGSKLKRLSDNWGSFTNAAMESKSSVSGAMLDMANNTVRWATTSKSPFADGIRNFVGLSTAIGPAVTMAGTFITNMSKITGVLGSTVKIVANTAKGFGQLVLKLLGVSTGNTAVAGTSAEAAAGTKATGTAAKGSGKSMAELGLAILEIGAGIALIIGSMAALVLAITELSKQGKQGIRTLTAVTVAISVILGVLALLGPALTAGSAGFLALGTAALEVGAGIALATAGMSALAFGVAAAVQAFANLIIALNNSNQAAQNAVPIMTAIGQGFAMMITSFVTTIATQAPLISQALLQMLLDFLNQLVTYTPQIVTKFAQILIGFLNALAKNIPKIVISATNLMIAFMNAVADSIPKIIPSAVNLIVTFVNSIADNLQPIIDAAINLIFKFIDGLVQAIPNIADKAQDAVMKFVYGVGYTLGEVLRSGGELIDKFIKGITDGFNNSNRAGKGAGNNAKDGAGSISLNSVGRHLVDGFIEGIRDKINDAARIAANMAKAAFDAAKSVLGIHSPSRRFKEIGMFTVAGFIGGVDDNASKATNSISDMAQGAINAAGKIVDGQKFNLGISPELTNGVSLSDDGTVKMKMEDRVQPAYINMQMGNNTYQGFVNDISTQQGNNIDLRRNNAIQVY
ncbi:phage tail tape measure protein [Eupransor demetentiae]|uniref:Phage-related protein n=1 Tax=Eupransor demetentiae TaxID=3109584 RepID=A0ABP0EP99_9LACO|nr:Phage-related protein [Lactobacillaceae bacterium LMG 33000]